MASPFEFQAPQFVDFNSGFDDSDDADRFFDVEEGTPRKDDNKENKLQNSIVYSHDVNSAKNGLQKTHSSVTESIAVYKTAIADDEKQNSNKKRKEMVRKAVRRLSAIKKEEQQPCVENVPYKANIEDNLSEGLNNISLRTKKRTHFEGIEIKAHDEKEHCMVTRNDQKIKTPKIDLRTRSVTKNNGFENKKRKGTFTDGTEAKYMAMAEHIMHFQRDTPPRFHTSRRRSSGVHGNLLRMRQSYKPRRTIALTPKLLTSFRSRPVAVPSQEQREEMELEEIKKHQIKANPLNDKVLRPPKLPTKSEKPNTTAEPFNLTEMKKPTPVIHEDTYKFTAKPLPKTIFKKPVGIAPKKEIPITIPESPSITKPGTAYYNRVRVPAISNDNHASTEDLTGFGVPMPRHEVQKRTSVKPFSFEVRDKEMMEKKEKRKKEIFEAEKRAREFKANPVPSFVATKETHLSISRLSHLDCSRISKSLVQNEDCQKPFRARSPRVLRKEPFVPVKEHIHSEPLDIQLWTELRAQERKEFELKQMEKEEHLAGLKELAEIRKKEKEEAEIAKLRKELVHKAQPMPKFKSVPLNEKVSSSQLLTNPQSPRFSKRSRTTTLCSSSKDK